MAQQPSTEGYPAVSKEEETASAKAKAKPKSQEKKSTKEKKERVPSEERYDYQRAEGPDPRDGRCHGFPCFGAHQPMAEGKGSLSGRNKHGRWTVCAQCRLRIQYVPALGATCAYRQAGPLAPDAAMVTTMIKEKIHEPLEKEKLNSKTCSAIGAEESLRARLSKLEADRSAKTPQLRPGAKAMTPPPKAAASSQVTETTKKPTKRENVTTPEKSEADQEWQKVQYVDD